MGGAIYPDAGNMEYYVESIGAEFSDKAVTALAGRFSQRSGEGWKLHSVFQAQQPGGCLSNTPTITYFAIYVKE